MREAQFAMNDYQHIRLGAEQTYRKLRSQDTFHFHRRSLAFLEQKLSEPFQGATVVITHHAPSPRSLNGSAREELVSAAYCSDLESLILRHQPTLWIHGHIHRAADYTLGESRVLCNPRGYAPHLLVEGATAEKEWTHLRRKVDPSGSCMI